MHKKRWEVGYKVVSRNTDEKLWLSAFVPYEYECVYGLNTITKRPDDGGPLFVFKEKEKAIRFLNNLEENLGIISFLFKCQFKRSNDNCGWLKVKENKLVSAGVPSGTFFADEVKLIKRLRKREKK